MGRPALLAGLALAVLVALPAPALATPAPTEPPASSTGDGGSTATPKPQPTAAPTEPPAMVYEIPAPAREDLHVGYTGSGVLAQAPLLVAEQAGFFDDSGLTRVIVARSGDVLQDVRRGDLDIGVVPVAEAYRAAAQDPSLRVLAGYRNYDPVSGDYRGEVLVAAPGMVADEPATVLAFLVAYLRALDLFTNEDGQAQAYDLIAATDLVFNISLADWAAAVAAYAPFDGGFGALEDEGGLGELADHLAQAGVTDPDPEVFLADHTLAIAQTWTAQPANPLNPLAGPPGVDEIVVAIPDGGDSPIAAALDAGYFSDAGFATVEIVDADEPLLGVLQGQVEFGVMDTSATTEAAEQGLPLAAVAGHRNYDVGGSYGGDMLVASRDLIEQEASTASAFLIGYVRALQELAEPAGAAAYAPFDGGFGDREQAGGLGELASYLGATPDTLEEVTGLGDTRALEYAQAWLGLPVNPVTTDLSTAEGE